MDPHHGDGVQDGLYRLAAAIEARIGQTQRLAGERRIQRDELRNFFKRNVFVSDQSHQPQCDGRERRKPLQELAGDRPSRGLQGRHGYHLPYIAKTGNHSSVFVAFSGSGTKYLDRSVRYALVMLGPLRSLAVALALPWLGIVG